MTDAQIYRLSTSKGELVSVAGEAKAGVADILDLGDFSDKSLLSTLRVRYRRDEVYTFVGPILLSINPYHWVEGAYGEETMQRYHGAHKQDQPPHLYKASQEPL
jgi:myosin heavy subunit